VAFSKLLLVLQFEHPEPLSVRRQSFGKLPFHFPRTCFSCPLLGQRVLVRHPSPSWAISFFLFLLLNQPLTILLAVPRPVGEVSSTVRCSAVFPSASCSLCCHFFRRIAVSLFRSSRRRVPCGQRKYGPRALPLLAFPLTQSPLKTGRRIVKPFPFPFPFGFFFFFFIGEVSSVPFLRTYCRLQGFIHFCRLFPSQYLFFSPSSVDRGTSFFSPSFCVLCR